MKRSDLNFGVIVLLTLSTLYLAITGILMDWLGLHRVAFHNYVGYAWVGLALLHLGLSWGQMRVHWRHRFRLRHSHEPAHSPSLPSSSRRQWLSSTAALIGGFLMGLFWPVKQAAPFIQSQEDIDLTYHQWSKIGLAQAGGALFHWGQQPRRYKTYAEAVSVPLPEPREQTQLSFEAVLNQRRSRREYTDAPISLEQLSFLLQAAQGITETLGEKRSVPSAGALYPLEVYAVVNAVENLPSGIYHYAVQPHQLEQLKAGDFRRSIVSAAVWQDFLGTASVCFVITALFQRTRWKYRERTYRYVMMEAGHLGQNLYLAATALGLGVCAVGAFFDDALNDLLGLEGETEAAVYIISIGQLERA
ncbi:MAG: SagB/ThcOx family dehydrogenase [Leptolyngbyaceae cyanobacterium MO_188.B28]|nr:SagB/ThcOx family dehydrogenase [Leptolyngbyaceae cyanobacterium MO_188.B28]